MTPEQIPTVGSIVMASIIDGSYMRCLYTIYGQFMLLTNPMYHWMADEILSWEYEPEEVTKERINSGRY